MTTLRIKTELGTIDLKLCPDAAPVTVQHIQEAVKLGLYDGCSFYRSDFVIQCGVHGTNRKHPSGDLTINETSRQPRISNTRGTVAVAHFDVPDCGSTEFFINLQANTHLDNVYGGYCVFAQVESPQSFAIVDAIAAAILQGQKPKIHEMSISN
jgi:cyclophilin family peptidyl-prolyl cis-trans isomerase